MSLSPTCLSGLIARHFLSLQYLTVNKYSGKNNRRHHHHHCITVMALVLAVLLTVETTEMFSG